MLLLVAQLSKAVVAEADHLVQLLRRLAEALQRRLRIGEDLLIILVLVDDLLAHIEIIERRQRAHALTHVLIVAGDLRHLVEELLREEMRVGVDAHKNLRSWLAAAYGALVVGGSPRQTANGSMRCYRVAWPESTPEQAACDTARRGLSRPERLS